MVCDCDYHAFVEYSIAHVSLNVCTTIIIAIIIIVEQ